MKTRLLFAMLLLAPLACAAQFFRVEVHPVRSLTMTDEEFLTGRKDAAPVLLAGQLRIPAAATGRVPAVLLLHGSGGIGVNLQDWEQEFNALGVASFVLDSFTGRGLVSTSADQASLGRLAMTYDAYRAFEVLERHARIDPQRIVVMGFSRGGQAALYAAMKRFQRMHGPASGRDFAAYIALYPNCATTFIDDEELSQSPIRIHHGAADNYVPVAPCRAYVARLKGKANVVLAEYPGAHHVFDGRSFKTPVIAAKSQTTRACVLQETLGGVIVNAKSGQRFTYADPCVELGPTIAYDEHAHAAAVKSVREFIRGAFHM